MPKLTVAQTLEKAFSAEDTTAEVWTYLKEKQADGLIESVKAMGKIVREKGESTSGDRVSVKIDKGEMDFFIKLGRNTGKDHKETVRILLGLDPAPDTPEAREESEDDKKYAEGRMIHLIVEDGEKDKVDAAVAKLPPFIKPKSPNSLVRFNLYAIDLETGQMVGSGALA